MLKRSLPDIFSVVVPFQLASEYWNNENGELLPLPFLREPVNRNLNNYYTI